ncbi:outer membrane receptor for ferrienterochelin and colicin [Chryseobacterium defluvii]|uniref:Outer membrane receptor for ferrienterochelin and colicin n=1 Tax=Chryseobacterium defluvii TaxID=160396 RepID=A0A840KFG9_9FLAO|nr:TonB-dependent receptor [Chryseobacterium defluvii]MBB4805692.1 outer membrane receptor for ferrienterochelin and colicin [Chryseobacterium defluvii]
MKKNVFLLAFQFVILSVSGQSLTGIVVEADNRKPISGVRVGIENTGIWTVTDPSGVFHISYNSNETLIFSRAGLVEEKKTYAIVPSDRITVEMQIASIRIKEIMLSAKKKNYSEIEIKEEALKNIQAFSLNEVLEQIPGQKLRNLDLNEFKPVVFRSVTTDNIAANGNEGFGNKSFGTAIVVDGIPISNNENMQGYTGNYASFSRSLNHEGALFSPHLLGFGAEGGYFSNANFGADLREIPVENIESVEVVQGIPSAKYGDLTSGLVNIQQKSGKTPYRAYVALREGTQEYNINKGFQLNEKLGFLNVNLNYLSSNSDARTKFNRYQRVATSLMWTIYNKNKNISNSFSIDYGNNLDNANFEEEDIYETVTKNKKRDFRISNRFNWRFKNSFFDNLNINANYTQGYQNSYESRIVNNGGDVVGTSTSEGVYVGAYTPISYRQVQEVEGKPISMFLSADLKKNVKTKSNWVHNFLIGTSFRSSDNKGAGRLGSPETLIVALAGGGQAFRPYNFGENVRAEYQYSVYAEDNIFKKFGSYVFNLNAGVRFDNQFGASVLQPRINAYLIYKDFKFRGGFGIASKAPSMNMIYTGPRYYDEILADVRLPGYYNLGIVQTFVDYSDNKGLKPSKSMRSEIGLDYRFPFGNVGLTAYYNKLYDGFTNEYFAAKRGMAELQINYNGNNIPTYDIIGYTDHFYIQNKIVNSLKSEDKGLELMLNLNKLPLKNISLDINGSYVETKNNSHTDRYYEAKNYNDGAIYGLYRSYEPKYRQLNLGGTLNYHLPKAGLVISLRSQHFIIDDKIRFNPKILYAYINRDLEKVTLTQEQINDPAQFASIKDNNVDETNEKLDKVFHNFNLKISKDFQNGFKFSFYANNFLDLKQTQVKYSNGSYINTLKADLLQLSFGAKIEYQF